MQTFIKFIAAVLLIVGIIWFLMFLYPHLCNVLNYWIGCMEDSLKSYYEYHY